MTGSLIFGDAYFSEGDTRGQLGVSAYAQGSFSRLRTADRSDWVREFARTFITIGRPSTGLYVYVCIYMLTQVVAENKKGEGGKRNREWGSRIGYRPRHVLD